MRTLAIRYWLTVALAVYFIGAVSPFVFVGTVVCSKEGPSKEAATLGTRLSAEVDQWTNPAWQKELSATLPARLSMVLLVGDQEVFRAGKPPVDPTDAGRTQIVVMNGTQQVGIANLYDVSPCGGQIYGTLAMPLSLLIQLFVGLCIAWILNRYVLKPLAAMSHGPFAVNLAKQKHSSTHDRPVFMRTAVGWNMACASFVNSNQKAGICPVKRRFILSTSG